MCKATLKATMRKAGRGVLALGLVLGIAIPGADASAREGLTAALPASSAAAEVKGEARPILAWMEFCRSYPSECALDPREPARVSLTPALWSAVVALNRRVNRNLIAQTDQDHWGLADRWDLAEDGIGDCEDYQLLKRHLLTQAGLPRRAMRMTVVIDEKGEGHAVLTVLTDRGDFVLDNKTDAVMAWHETGYTFIKREGQDSQAWVSLGGVTSPTVTANR